MLLLIGAIVAAVIIVVWAVEPRQTEMSKEDEYWSMECTALRQHRLNSCC